MIKIFITFLIYSLIGTGLFYILTIIFLINLPEDFLVRNCEDRKNTRVFLRILFCSIRNIIGLLLILGGIIMLFTPGPGMISIFIGILAIDFPLKYRVVRRFIEMRGIFENVNNLRCKFGRPPLIYPDIFSTKEERSK